MNTNRYALSHIRFAVIATAAITLLSADVNAQRETPPAPEQPRNFTLPAKQQFTLPNGMKVTMVPFGAIPKVDVQLVVRAGNVDERADQIWLADMMSDMMREGTAKRTASQINTAAASMGGTINTGVGSDETTVSASALSEHAGEIVRMVAEVALQPAFPESEFARIKQNRLRTLALSKAQPQTIATEKFYNVMFPDHAYGRLFPTETMIQNYTIQQVKDFYNANFKASRAHLFIAGQFDANAIQRVVREAFSSWTTGTPLAPPLAKPVARKAIYIIDRPGAVQSTIYMGAPTIDPSHPDYRAMQLTNTLLGGAFGSRITKNLREDKGYTYSPFSQISSRYRNAYWAEVADVTTAVTGASLKEIFAEIDKLQATPPSAEELDRIKNIMVGGYVMNGSTRGGVIGLLRSLNLHGLPESYASDYVKQVYAVTPADVTRMAQKYIDDQNFAIVIVGDRKVIEEQVKPYGPIVAQ